MLKKLLVFVGPDSMPYTIELQVVNRPPYALGARTLSRMGGRTKAEITRSVKDLLEQLRRISMLRTTQTNADNATASDFLYLSKSYCRLLRTVVTYQIRYQRDLDL